MSNAIHDQFNKNISVLLRHYLQKHVGINSFQETYEYSVIPAGKLFRPILASLAYCDFGKHDPEKIQFNPKDSISLFSSALELHHVYTLMHDDLPCMDDDEMRRGRKASHIQFSQWKALLAGDGLSILSFNLMSQMDIKQAQKLIKIATWTTGPKGLIYGQYLDLSQEMTKSFANVMETHLLKTARLIQLSLLGGQIIAEDQINQNSKEIWKFGKSLGIIFQLLDDLDDYLELEDNDQSHEAKINPWINYPMECENQLLKEFNSVKRNSEKLTYTKEYINDFLDRSRLKLTGLIHESGSNKNLDQLLPTLSSLNL